MQPSGVTVRPLGPEDAEAFRDVRLRGLREVRSPSLRPTKKTRRFPSRRSARASRARTRPRPCSERFAQRRSWGRSASFVTRYSKSRHRATLWGMYVVAEERGQRIGAALLDAAMDWLRAVGDVEQAELTVVAGADAARRLYLRAGFEVCGRVPGAMKVGDARVDEEMMARRLDMGRGRTDAPQVGSLDAADLAMLEQLAGRAPSECLPHARGRTASRASQTSRRAVRAVRARQLRGSLGSGPEAGAPARWSGAFGRLGLRPSAPESAGAAWRLRGRLTHGSEPHRLDRARHRGRLRPHQRARARVRPPAPGGSSGDRPTLHHPSGPSCPALRRAARALAALQAVRARDGRRCGRRWHAFEVGAIVEQISVCSRVMDAWAERGAPLTRRKATMLTTARGRPIGERVRSALREAEPSL